MGANSYKQLCWRCKKSCDRFACVWVRTLKKRPKGCKVESGYIIECPKFEQDDLIYRKYEKNKIYVLNKSKYLRILRKITTKHLHMSVVEYLKSEGYTNVEFDEDVKDMSVECKADGI